MPPSPRIFRPSYGPGLYVCVAGNVAFKVSRLWHPWNVTLIYGPAPAAAAAERRLWTPFVFLMFFIMINLTPKTLVMYVQWHTTTYRQWSQKCHEFLFQSLTVFTYIDGKRSVVQLCTWISISTNVFHFTLIKKLGGFVSAISSCLNVFEITYKLSQIRKLKPILQNSISQRVGGA